MLKVISCNSYAEIPHKAFPELNSIKGKVFIKPNWVYPEAQSCTSIKLIKSIIENLTSAEEIIVGECGYKGLWEKYEKMMCFSLIHRTFPKVKIMPLELNENYHKFSLCRIKDYSSLYGILLSDYYIECDTVINVPKLKSHSMCRYTGAIKNLMGVMRQKGNMHVNGSEKILNRRLPDLFQFHNEKVQYTIMDGIIGSEYSECGGLPKKVGNLVIGSNMWDVDVLCARMIGMNPKAINYLNTIASAHNYDFDRKELFPSEIVRFEEAPLFQNDSKYL